SWFLQAEVVIEFTVENISALSNQLKPSFLPGGIGEIDVVGKLLGNIKLLASQTGPVQIKSMHIKQVVSEIEVIAFPEDIRQHHAGICVSKEIRHIGYPVLIDHTGNRLAFFEFGIVAKILVGDTCS